MTGEAWSKRTRQLNSVVKIPKKAIGTVDEFSAVVRSP